MAYLTEEEKMTVVLGLVGRENIFVMAFVGNASDKIFIVVIAFQCRWTLINCFQEVAVYTIMTTISITIGG